MSYVEWHCRGCGERMGICGEYSDDPEDYARELDDEYNQREEWDQRHAKCDEHHPARPGIVAALIRSDRDSGRYGDGAVVDGWEDAERVIDQLATVSLAGLDVADVIIDAALARTPADDFQLGQWKYCRAWRKRNARDVYGNGMTGNDRET